MENFTAVVNNIPSTKRTLDEENNQAKAIVDRQPFSRALLLSTTYSLNASGTKIVTIGFGLDAGQNFDVAIKFSGRYTSGIFFTVAEWQTLCSHRTTITSWFNEQQTGENNITPVIQWTGRQKINFTTAYNEKAIVLTLKEPEDIAQLKKAKKAFSSDVVMQKKTYEGLLALIPCINNKIYLLREELELVNRLKDILVERLSVELSVNGYLDLQREQLDAATLKILRDEYTNDVWDRINVRNFYSPKDDEIDDKHCLIGSELICLHYEYIFRSVMDNIKKNDQVKKMYTKI